ncbi:hypothetical protein ASF12_09820 [Paenibacillus sp. Leaf72]|nr:hypothetical protein ASF12_09820 [Paenibacillus sp. Leaf72]
MGLRARIAEAQSAKKGMSFQNCVVSVTVLSVAVGLCTPDKTIIEIDSSSSIDGTLPRKLAVPYIQEYLKDKLKQDTCHILEKVLGNMGKPVLLPK